MPFHSQFDGDKSVLAGGTKNEYVDTAGVGGGHLPLIIQCLYSFIIIYFNAFVYLLYVVYFLVVMLNL